MTSKQAWGLRAVPGHRHLALVMTCNFLDVEDFDG
jgi:hypothetical protein